MHRFGGSFLRYGDLVTHFIRDVVAHLQMWMDRDTVLKMWVFVYICGGLLHQRRGWLIMDTFRDSFQDEAAHLKIQ